MWFSNRTGQTALPTHRQSYKIHSIEEQPRMYVLCMRADFKENQGRSVLIFFKTYQSGNSLHPHGVVWKEKRSKVKIYSVPWL